MGALNIKDTEVAKKAKRLAQLKGTSITAAVSAALEESLQRAERYAELDREARERCVDEAIERIRAATPPDAPSFEEIMADMYDEDGLPR